MTADKAGDAQQQPKPQVIFISYAHDEDMQDREELCKWLELLEEKKKITVWHDKKMLGGSNLQEEIKRNMEKTDIFLLLLSVDSLRPISECKKERERALELTKEKGVAVVPIPIRSCAWRDPFYGIYNLLAPHDGKAIDELEEEIPRSKIWLGIQTFIGEVVDKRLKRQREESMKEMPSFSNSLPLISPPSVPLSLPMKPIAATREYNKEKLLTRQIILFRPASRKTLLAAMLVGYWHADNPDELSRMAELADMPIKEFSDELESLQIDGIPFISRRDNIWKAESQKLFDALPKILNPEILDRFRQIAVNVLPNTDARSSDLPGWAPLCYSNSFKKKIADMIALLAYRGDQHSVWPHSYTIADRMATCVRDILDPNMSVEKWIALDGYLPLLAEAAPAEFLNAGEKTLSENPAAILAMFGGGNSGDCNHPGLLWALECLCWHSDYLHRAVMILVALVQKEAESAWENKPINSLMKIFLPWIRNVPVSIEDKLKILDSVIDKNPEVAWRLLYSLMPGINNTSSGIYFPQHRDWAVHHKQDISRKDYRRYVIGIFERILPVFENNSHAHAEDFLIIINSCRQFPADYRQKFYHVLLNASKKNWSDSGARVSFGRELGKMIRRHRQYADAHWALPEDELKILDEVYNLVVSGNLIEQYRYLFDEDHPDMPGFKLDDFEGQRHECRKLQQEAIIALWESGGWESIIMMANDVSYPDFLGTALANSEIGELAWEKISPSIDSKNIPLVKLAREFIFTYSQKNPDWAKNELDSTRDSWSPKRQASFLLGLRQDLNVLNLLKKFPIETQNLYWKDCFKRHWFGVEVKDIVWVIEQLNDHKRPALALSTARLFCYDNKERKLPSRLLADALELILRFPELRRDGHSLSYDIPVAITTLQQDGTLDENRLFHIEWSLFEFFKDNDCKPVTVAKKIAREPEFFSKLIAQVYHPKDAEMPDEESPATQVAQQVFEILNYFSGSSLYGRGMSLKWESPTQAKNWARKVHELCAQSKRGEPGDYCIGEILSNTEYGADGLWPSDAAREILEDLQNNEIEKGMITGRFNQRGAYYKGLNEGGQQEHKIADEYEEWAKAMLDKWPRTAKVLRELSESYRYQARREDNRRGMGDF